jgi:hypothetical protein
VNDASALLFDEATYSTVTEPPGAIGNLNLRLGGGLQPRGLVNLLQESVEIRPRRRGWRSRAGRRIPLVRPPAVRSSTARAQRAAARARLRCWPYPAAGLRGSP